MASVVDIYNGALIKLGASTITATSDNTPGANALRAVYDRRRQSLLRSHPWNFAIVRAKLAASLTAPLFDRTNAFPLPSDCLRPLPPDPESNFNDRDWIIEGRSIITNDSAPLNLRYISDVTDPNLMDAIFREALATDLALEICEKITQSNTKKQDLGVEFKEIISEARHTNAIEVVSAQPPEDTWITVRS